MSPRMRWSLWMTVAGVTTAVVVYLLTNSIGWAIAGSVACGIVMNAIAESLANGSIGRGRSRRTRDHGGRR